KSVVNRGNPTSRPIILAGGAVCCHVQWGSSREIQLALPCDEGLWACTSASEALRLEQTPTTVGVKPITFLAGRAQAHTQWPEVVDKHFWKDSINGRITVCSYHMHQRDLQVTAVGTGAQ